MKLKHVLIVAPYPIAASAILQHFPGDEWKEVLHVVEEDDFVKGGGWAPGIGIDLVERCGSLQTHRFQPLIHGFRR